jgi:hypothetical protein
MIGTQKGKKLPRLCHESLKLMFFKLGRQSHANIKNMIFRLPAFHASGLLNHGCGASGLYCWRESHWIEPLLTFFPDDTHAVNFRLHIGQ